MTSRECPGCLRLLPGDKECELCRDSSNTPPQKSIAHPDLSERETNAICQLIEVFAFDREESEKIDLYHRLAGYLASDKKQHLKAALEAAAAAEKACPICFRIQSINRDVCELCDEKPEQWLPSRTDDEDVQWKMSASSDYSADNLRQVIRERTTDLPDWKCNHAANVLQLLGEEIPWEFYSRPFAQSEPFIKTPIADQNSSITGDQVTRVLQHLELQRQQAERETNAV